MYCKNICTDSGCTLYRIRTAGFSTQIRRRLLSAGKNILSAVSKTTTCMHLYNTFRMWILIYLLKFRKTYPLSLHNPRVACCLFIQALSQQESTDPWVLFFQDTPGFIVNRLLVPYMMEAVRMLERGELNNVCILLSTEQQLNQTEDKSSHFSLFLTI